MSAADVQRPGDIVPPMVFYCETTANGVRIDGFVNPAAHRPACLVYWGSHGCCRPRGHDGDHWCDCCECEAHPDPDSGCVAGPPYYGTDTNFWGDDA